MKKYFCRLLFVLCACVPLLAESYIIQDVHYDISGITREYALSQQVPVETGKIFLDSDSLERYIGNIQQSLLNQRVFQTSNVDVTYSEVNENGMIPVTIFITTEDTLNIIAVPYPSYNSNTGLELKIKVKDYNFFGSMEPMDFDLNYQAKGSDQEKVTHIFGINFDFSVPFKLINLPSSWDSSFTFEYIVGGEQLDMNISEGISVTLPITGVTSAELDFKQYYIQDSEYLETEDSKYFKEEISFSLPLKLGYISNWSEIKLIPFVSFNYAWDFDVFKGVPYSGITSEEIRGPILSLGYNLKTKQINWLGNFRDGFSGSLNQTYSVNLFDNSKAFSTALSGEYHHKFNQYIGFSSRGYWYKDFFDNTEKPGKKLRGLRDNDYKSSDYVAFNFDLPIKLFQTDWRALFGWDKLSFIDFEFQVSPFFDFSLGENLFTNTNYSLKDGLYGSGIEFIVYPDRFRSLQGRISFGVDNVLFLQKIGKKVSSLNGLTEKMFNTNWRKQKTSSWFELSIGIGLFY